MSANTVNCQQSDRVARFELALDQWILSLSPESPRIQPAIAETTKKSNHQSSLNEQSKKVLLSPLLESFESNGNGYDGRVSTGMPLRFINWESFGYYTGWLLHCDRSQGRFEWVIGRRTKSCRDSRAKTENFTRFRMEWIATGDVDCDHGTTIARF